MIFAQPDIRIIQVPSNSIIVGILEIFSFCIISNLDHETVPQSSHHHTLESTLEFLEYIQVGNLF